MTREAFLKWANLLPTTATDRKMVAAFCVDGSDSVLCGGVLLEKREVHSGG